MTLTVKNNNKLFQPPNVTRISLQKFSSAEPVGRKKTQTLTAWQRTRSLKYAKQLSTLPYGVSACTKTSRIKMQDKARINTFYKYVYLPQKQKERQTKIGKDDRSISISINLLTSYVFINQRSRISPRVRVRVSVSIVLGLNSGGYS